MDIVIVAHVANKWSGFDLQVALEITAPLLVADRGLNLQGDLRLAPDPSYFDWNRRHVFKGWRRRRRPA